MARKTLSSLTARITELEAANAALEARLAFAREVFTNQRTRVRELEAALNTRGTKTVAIKPQPVVTHFVRRDGTRCEKVRIGNRAVTREMPRGVEAAELSMAEFEAAA